MPFGLYHLIGRVFGTNAEKVVEDDAKAVEEGLKNFAVEVMQDLISRHGLEMVSIATHTAITEIKVMVDSTLSPAEKNAAQSTAIRDAVKNFESVFTVTDLNNIINFALANIRKGTA